MKIAIVGATGAVGTEMLEILAQRKFPATDVVPFASARSEGKKLRLGRQEYPCQVLRPGCFDGVDLAFFDASDEISQQWVPQAAEAGAWVVDNSGTWRMDPKVLLAVPEINAAEIRARLPRGERVFSGPNCSTVQLVIALHALKPLGLKRVVCSTYQSTSGAGQAALNDFRRQTSETLAGRVYETDKFPHEIAFNCIPQVGSFKGSDTTEELKMVRESRKILALPELRMTVTTVRVPTLACHSEAVNVEFERPATLEEVRKLLTQQEGLELTDPYPMGTRAAGKDPVFIGRLRLDSSVESGVNFWCVSDNLRKGAALNAIQIAEVILGE